MTQIHKLYTYIVHIFGIKPEKAAFSGDDIIVTENRHTLGNISDKLVQLQEEVGLAG